LPHWESLHGALRDSSPHGASPSVSFVAINALDLHELTTIDLLIIDGSPKLAEVMRRFCSAAAIIVCSDEAAPAATDVIVIATDTTIAQIAGIVQGAALCHGVISSMRLAAESATAEATSASKTVRELVTELDTAARIQSAFNTTTLPALESCRLGCLWKPADRLSGDVYEISTHADRWITLFLADVVGHGLGPALMTMMIRQTITACQRDRAGVPSPSQLLSSINSVLLNRTGEETHFATAICVVIDTHTATASLAGAGHPAALIRSLDGTTQRIPSRGALLGVFAEEAFPTSTIPLCQGDRLMLYSDGFEQVFGSGVDGVEAALLESAGRGDPEMVIDDLEDRIRRATEGNRPGDDLTLLCLQLDHVGAEVVADQGIEVSDAA